MSSTVSAVAAAAASSSSSSSLSASSSPTVLTGTDVAAINILLTQPINATERQFEEQGGDPRGTEDPGAKVMDPSQERVIDSTGTKDAAAAADDDDGITDENRISPLEVVSAVPTDGKVDLIPRAVSSSATSSSSSPSSSEDEGHNITTRALLTKVGFDPDDLNKRNTEGWIPIFYFSAKGNVTMVRYLIARGADCRKTLNSGFSALRVAALNGHLEVMKMLCLDGGVHEDIRKQCSDGISPLRVALWNESLVSKALDRGHFRVVQWLTLNGALSSLHRRLTRSGINSYIMRRDFRQGRHWDYDKRQTLVTWAQNAVTTHEQFQLSSFIPLVELKGNSDVLESIAEYIGYRKRRELRIIRQLLQHLPAFIKDVPFVEKEKEEDEDEEDEDEEAIAPTSTGLHQGRTIRRGGGWRRRRRRRRRGLLNEGE